VSWDEDLFAAFDDLEAQAEALVDAERAAELADRSRSEYAAVTLAGRLMASTGREVACAVRGPGQVRGTLQRVAGDWSLVHGHGQDWVLRHAAVVSVRGLSDRAVPRVAWPVTARLGFAAALRRLADAGERCVVHLLDGGSHDVVLHRIGADFAEARTVRGGDLVVATAAIAAVQSREVTAEV
jgi:hypothetical protein